MSVLIVVNIIVNVMDIVIDFFSLKNIKNIMITRYEIHVHFEDNDSFEIIKKMLEDDYMIYDSSLEYNELGKYIIFESDIEYVFKRDDIIRRIREFSKDLDPWCCYQIDNDGSSSDDNYSLNDGEESLSDND